MSPRQRRDQPETLVDRRKAEATELYETRLAKAASRRFPTEETPFMPGVSIPELAALAVFLGRDLEADMRAAEKKAAA